MLRQHMARGAPEHRKHLPAHFRFVRVDGKRLALQRRHRLATGRGQHFHGKRFKLDARTFPEDFKPGTAAVLKIGQFDRVLAGFQRDFARFAGLHRMGSLILHDGF